MKDLLSMKFRLLLAIAVCAGLAACAGAPPERHAVADWHAVPLPGKESTLYTTSVKDGTDCKGKEHTGLHRKQVLQ